MIAPLPVTLLVTSFGAPSYMIAPDPGTAASRLFVAVTWIRPEHVGNARPER